MQYVGFEQFIQELKKAKAWRLEGDKDRHGIILTVGEGDNIRQFHSPNPLEETDLDWGLFTSRIGAVIDMRGGVA